MIFKRSGLTHKAGWLLLLVIPLALFARPILRGEVLIPGDILPVIDDVWAAKVTPNNPLLSDVLLQFYPWQKFAATTIAHHEVPLWNPFVMAGAPFLANDQSAIFEPLRLVTLIIRSPVEQSFLWLAIARLALFGIFTWMYLRRKEFSGGVAVIGAGLAMLATPVIAWLSYPLFATFLWFPLMLYGVEEIRAGSRRGWFGLALATAAQWLSGNIQISIFLLLTTLAYSLFAIRLNRRQWATLGVGLILGTGIAAIQLLPAAEYVRQSTVYESGRGGYGEKSIWQAAHDGAWRGWPSRSAMRLSLERLLPVVSPFINGNPASGTYRFPGRDVYANFNELAGSIGLVGILLALLGLMAAWRERLVRFAAGGSVVIVGMIAHAPVFELLNYLPLIQRTQTDRLRFILVFFLVILAAYGLRALLEQKLRWVQSAILLLGGLGIMAMVDWKLGAGADWKKEIIIGALAVFIIVVATIKKITGPAQSVVIGLAALAAPLFLLHSFNTTVSTDSFYPASPVIQALQSRLTPDDRVVSFDVGGGRTPLEPNTAMNFQIHDVRGYDVVRLKRYDELVDGVVTRSGSHLKGAAKPSPILDALAVHYAVVAARDVAELDPLLSAAGWRDIADDAHVRLYENPNLFPRAFVAATATFASSPSESLKVVRQGDFDPRLPVIETTGHNAVDVIDTFPATILHETANTITVSAAPTLKGYLILADAFAPGWTAIVNGRPAEVLIADHALRAVAVPAGQSTVVWKYQPASFRWGVIISLASLLSLVGLNLVMKRRR